MVSGGETVVIGRWMGLGMGLGVGNGERWAESGSRRAQHTLPLLTTRCQEGFQDNENRFISLKTRSFSLHLVVGYG